MHIILIQINIIIIILYCSVYTSVDTKIINSDFIEFVLLLAFSDF